MTSKFDSTRLVDEVFKDKFGVERGQQGASPDKQVAEP